jgi:endonuclease/exonuclease/phosphatase family metal-dependent hydrolase
MRVVTYNILDGGEGRADPLAEVLEAQRPDIISLVEADVPAVVERIAKRLSMDFIVAPGDGHCSALLSRWPIQQTINHAALNQRFSRSFLEATVVDPAGKQWPIGVLHLPAQATEEAENLRMMNLQIVLKLFEKYRLAGQSHLLCGDFNSTSPHQRIDPGRCKHKTQEAWKSNGNRLPRRVVQTLLDAGYFDTYAAIHDEQREMIGSFTTQHPGQRVDYIFAFGVPTVAVKDAWVEHDRLARYASDHFPVGVEMGS